MEWQIMSVFPREFIKNGLSAKWGIRANTHLICLFMLKHFIHNVDEPNIRGGLKQTAMLTLMPIYS